MEHFDIKGRARLEITEEGILIRPAPEAVGPENSSAGAPWCRGIEKGARASRSARRISGLVTRWGAGGGRGPGTVQGRRRRNR